MDNKNNLGHKKIKGLFVIDIDGTLVDSRKGIPDINIKACNRLYAEFGIVPVIATARPLEVAKYIANKCGPAFQNYIISTNGAILTDLQSGENLVEKRLSPEVTSKLVEICERNNLEWEFMTTQEEVAMEQYKDQRCEDPMYQKMGTEFHYQKDLKKCLNNLHAQNIPVPLFAISGSAEQLNDINRELNEIGGLSISGLCERTNPKGEKIHFVDIMADGATKSSAIEELSKRLGIPQKAIIAIGDGGNDKEMIEMAGHGVAMKNAKPNLKLVANHVTLLDNEQGGVGYFAVMLLRHLRRKRNEKNLNRSGRVEAKETVDIDDSGMLGRRKEDRLNRQKKVQELRREDFER